MASRWREAVAPLYLFACLVLGGSAQGIWFNMLLQLAGVAIIAWAAMSKSDQPLRLPERRLLLIAIAALAVVAVQLIPLPAALWPDIGPRERIAAGFSVLGLGVPAMPLSVAPHSSLTALLSLIPPLALLCAVLRLRAYRRSWLAIALIAGMIGGVLLGVLQVSGEGQARWYLYQQANHGVATGFFANSNHMATLLVVSLPFLAALLASAKGAKMQRFSAAVALTGGIALVVLVGLALNRSIAGYALTIPVLAGSALILFPLSSGVRRLAAIGAGLLLLAAVVALWSTPIGGRSLGSEASTSVQSRERILANSVRAAGDFLPLGSGPGTFRSVYRLYEDHDRLERTVVNHAHNDYVELALETGVPGILVLAAFLLWWASVAWPAWRQPVSPFGRAAVVASAAILAHSLVDFPLRTAAIAAVFATCLALLVERRSERRTDESELWPTRHVVLK